MRAPVTFAALAALPLLVGCASHSDPVLYPNARYDQVGEAAAKKDVQSCKDEAAKAGTEGNKTWDVAKTGAVGAAAGGATGAVAGAVGGGGAGTGAIVGAAVGATAGVISGLLNQSGPDPNYKAYVNKCLKEKGYDVVGWD